MKRKVRIMLAVLVVGLLVLVVAVSAFAAITAKIWEEDANTRTVMFSRLDVMSNFWTIDGYSTYVELPPTAVRKYYKSLDCGYNHVEVIRVYAKGDGTTTVDGACQYINPGMRVIPTLAPTQRP